MSDLLDFFITTYIDIITSYDLTKDHSPITAIIVMLKQTGRLISKYFNIPLNYQQD